MRIFKLIVLGAGVMVATLYEYFKSATEIEAEREGADDEIWYLEMQTSCRRR